MEGRTPEGMDEATAALFPDSFEPSELGEIPSGWRVGTLGQVAQTIRRQIQPEAMHESLNYIGLEHIPKRCLSLSDWGTAQGLESAKSCFSAGDILFGKLRPYFHKVIVAPMDGVCSTDILVCGPVSPSFYGFVTMQLFSDSLVAYADRLSNGAKMPRVNWKDLAAYEVVIPSEALAESYSITIQPLLDQMALNTFEAKTLADLRDTLLPRLISGQLRLPEAEEQVAEALA
jgi:type I restriction enzyme S subunit